MRQRRALWDPPPSWIDSARCYYSRIEAAPSDPVRVFAIDAADEVTEHNPGRVCLWLEPDHAALRVVAPELGVIGSIEHQGVLPYRRKVMCNASGTVWTLTVRSFFRERHRLQMAEGEPWIVETPSYWWQHVTAGPSLDREPELIGQVGPAKVIWQIGIAPGHDRLELLAAMACLHRQWWRL